MSQPTMPGGAGTQDRPWPTVQQAADLAVAGDTIVIEDGLYPENVVVKHSGEKGRPITFRAANNRGALLYSIVSRWAPGGRNGLWPSYWITIQGINFNSPATQGLDHAVYPITGWDIEDCTFQGHTAVEMHGQMAVNMGNVTARHCLFQDCYANSFGGYSGLTAPTDLLHDVLIQNCIVRRSNLSNLTNTGWDGGVNKFFNSQNVTVDGVISYDNNGNTIWFDTNNQNLPSSTVRSSAITAAGFTARIPRLIKLPMAANPFGTTPLAPLPLIVKPTRARD